MLHASEPTWSVYPTEATDLDCQTCGACCSYSSDWPQSTTETDEALDALSAHFVTADQRGMRCESSRCSALSGTVGETTTCLVYEARPDVCRACSPGDYACTTPRLAFGMAAGCAPTV
ncbi:YkgJ family cysteine cluster protein [Rhizobium rhizoryzae]|uniref:YkgJ family cysteine cluster protein n=1 Tax=Rhizobium rhizoryzae TaxID=451876 RepID=UPI0028A2CAFC|nr:YkgJ family cysteine cluster protein [Rhizobium rhizoryzae]